MVCGSVPPQGLCCPEITAWSSVSQLLQALLLWWTFTLLPPTCSISGVCYLEPRSSSRTWNARFQGPPIFRALILSLISLAVFETISSSDLPCGLSSSLVHTSCLPIPYHKLFSYHVTNEVQPSHPKKTECLVSVSSFWCLLFHIADSIMFIAHTLPLAVWTSYLCQLLTYLLLLGKCWVCSHLTVSQERLLCSKLLKFLFLLVLQEKPHPLHWCFYPAWHLSCKTCPRPGFYATCRVYWLCACNGFAHFAAASSKRYSNFHKDNLWEVLQIFYPHASFATM